MARIAGVNIPLNKRVEVGLTYIYGIGRPTSNELLKQAGIGPDTYVRDLTDEEVSKLRDLIDSDLTVEGDLRRERASATGSGSLHGSQSRFAGHRAERDHEGTTVGQADVREVQDHPPPWRRPRDL
jgi:ribosomal protein S13